MDLIVDPSSHTPIYQQIVRQIAGRIATGRLEPGERLPSVRRLAEELTVNPNTAARAYRQLERDGVVVSRPGDGVFVADQSSPFRVGERRKLLEAAAGRLLLEAEQLGASLDEVLETVRKAAEDGSRGPRAGGRASS